MYVCKDIISMQPILKWTFIMAPAMDASEEICDAFASFYKAAKHIGNFYKKQFDQMCVNNAKQTICFGINLAPINV